MLRLVSRSQNLLCADGRVGEKGGRVWGLWTGFCWLYWNPGRASQIEAVVIARDMSHEFCIECVTMFVVFMVVYYKPVKRLQCRRNQWRSLLSGLLSRLRDASIQPIIELWWRTEYLIRGHPRELSWNKDFWTICALPLADFVSCWYFSHAVGSSYVCDR